MNDEIDLRPYLSALLRRWWIILGTALGVALLVGVLAWTRIPPYAASTSLLIVPASTQVTLDNRFTSRDSLLFTTTLNQREALLGLARDATLEERVAAILESEGRLPDGYQLGDLSQRITIETNGDLVRITARADTADDARRLAALWGQEYTRLVNETYTRDTSSLELVEQQLTEARERYQAAQAELETFIAQGELAAAEQEVRRLSDLVNSARAAGTDRFADYLRRANYIEQILRDAQLLRQRLGDQSADEVNVADALAALLLRIRNLSDQGKDRPILQLDSSLTDNAVVTVADLDRLITSLQAEYQEVRNEAARLSELSPNELSPDSSQLLYNRLAAAQTRLERLKALERELTRNRDIAFGLIEVLMRRIDELRVADAAPQVSVRYLGTVTNPVAMTGRTVLTQAAIGALAGIFLASSIIMALEAVAVARRNTALTPKPAGD
ncbi:lipopolysaccharide biosynthesis protein [Chloroflexus sp.]|uniref:lipopolysaccharide biosynthesis protein n=1 Tax=Chloroflexus sp. TaxID=1904827 RepID=UPI002ADDD68D|nr:lipopolysaccharide biosynthesis protein [Chloroflexus sp.]